MDVKNTKKGTPVLGTGLLGGLALGITWCMSCFQSDPFIFKSRASLKDVWTIHGCSLSSDGLFTQRLHPWPHLKVVSLVVAVSPSLLTGQCTLIALWQCYLITIWLFYFDSILYKTEERYKKILFREPTNLRLAIIRGILVCAYVIPERIKLSLVPCLQISPGYMISIYWKLFIVCC